MNGRNLYRVLRIALCLAFIIVVFYLYLPQKTEMIKSMNATVGKNHVDVLCVGSSHIYTGIDPIQMYRDSGYATYTLGCGAMAPWQCYYNIKRACEDQTPHIIICDAYMLGITQDYRDYEDSNTVENMLNTPLSLDKVCTIMSSNAESRLDILLRFPYIYDDYGEFTGFSPSKFVGYEDYSMGYMPDTKVDGYIGDAYRVNTENTAPISSQNERSLKNIIEFCQHSNIDLILVNTPSMVVNDNTQPYYNYVGKIALEYGVPFIDGNRYQDEIKINWRLDTGDKGAHLNHSGVTKFTTLVEKYIEKNYDLPDRRSDDGYSEYDKGIEWLAEEIGEEIVLDEGKLR